MEREELEYDETKEKLKYNLMLKYSWNLEAGWGLKYSWMAENNWKLKYS